MTKWALFLNRLGLLLLTLQFGQAEESGSYAITVAKDIMVPMRDGVRLATDVYLPSRDGWALDERVPCLLMRLPYGKGEVHSVGLYYASHGYSVVIQDSRGRYKSEGTWHMLTDELERAYSSVRTTRRAGLRNRAAARRH